MGGEEAVIINEPELVHEILTTRAGEFHRTRTQKRLFGRIVGNGLIVSDGEHWHRQRRLAQPAFHHRQILTYFEAMRQIAHDHVTTWPLNTPMDFDKAVTDLTLNIVSVTLLGAQPPKETASVSTALAGSQRAAIRLMKFGVPLPAWLPTPSNLKLSKSVAIMDSVILPVIAERRNSREQSGDLLSMFIAAVDSEDPKRKMTDKQVRDEVVTMFLAGHDTTANLLTWTMHLLGQHPHHFAKLQQEVDEVFGNETPNVEGLRRLTFTDKILRESMRLYPPVYLILREPIQDIEMGGFKLRKGQMIMLSPWLLQRDPRNFENPDTFYPERFTPEKIASLPAGSYIPFGIGQHQCIGREFAMMEALIILSVIAQHYTPELCAGQRVEPEPLITLGTREGLRLKLIPRKSDS